MEANEIRSKQSRSLSRPRPKQYPEERLRLDDLCTPCRNKVGTTQISESALREICLKEQHKQNRASYNIKYTRKSSPKPEKKRITRQPSPRRHTKSINNISRPAKPYTVKRASEKLSGGSDERPFGSIPKKHLFL